MPVKVNFFFRYKAQGWSESFYRSAAFAGSDLVLMQNYINMRMKLAATQVQLISVRQSDVNSARDVTIYPIPLAGISGTWVYGTDGDTGPNQTASSVLLRLSDNAQHYRSMNLLGLPDHIIADNVIDPAEEALLNGRLNDWLGAVTSAGFTMRINSAPAISGVIDSFGPQTDAAPLVKIVTASPLPPKDSLVQITGSKPWRLLNRMWRVAASGAGQFSLAGSKSFQVFGEVEGGKYRVPVYTYAAIASYTTSRVSVRKTGVPFGVQRGRRSSRM